MCMVCYVARVVAHLSTGNFWMLGLISRMSSLSSLVDSRSTERSDSDGGSAHCTTRTIHALCDITASTYGDTSSNADIHVCNDGTNSPTRVTQEIDGCVRCEWSLQQQ